MILIRQHCQIYMIMKNFKSLRIGTDCDGCIDDFWNPYVERFGHPKNDFEITKNCQQKLSRDREFWINLPVLHRMNFTPELYCTKRTSSKNYLRHWLERNNFPKSPIYQVFYQYGSKAPLIKGRVDVFVDDSIANFLDINKAGIPCLLMDNPSNKHLGPMLRIHSLQLEEIEDVYWLAKEFGIFDNFKQYYDC